MLFNSIITCENRRTMSVQKALSSMRDDSMGHGFAAATTEAALKGISGMLFAYCLLSVFLAV